MRGMIRGLQIGMNRADAALAMNAQGAFDTGYMLHHRQAYTDAFFYFLKSANEGQFRACHFDQTLPKRYHER